MAARQVVDAGQLGQGHFHDPVLRIPCTEGKGLGNIAGLDGLAGVPRKQAMAGSHHFVHHGHGRPGLIRIHFGRPQAVLYFSDQLVVDNGLNRAKRIGAVQQPEGIMNLLGAAHGHVQVREQLLEDGLTARGLGIAHSGAGVAGNPVVPGELDTVDVVLIEFRATV
jgi:hypothetical protein